MSDASPLPVDLAEHLAWWGLRRFESDDAYFRWQRDAIPPQDLAELNRLVEAKRTDPALETAFYDATARCPILSVLHSQRYEYYQGVGALVAARLAAVPGGRVLDFGCGAGILTTFYARCFPNLAFVGVDRSRASIAAATERAAGLGLSNLRFDCLDMGLDRPRETPAGPFDAILSTHALVQAEQDPGLPSRDWRTFERARDREAQQDFEQRTGLGPRLDALDGLLAPEGRLIVFEKTRLLARRVPFQRAVAARGLRLLEPPVPLRYQLVEEVVDDGPLYVLGREGEGIGAVPATWNEEPETNPGDDLYYCRGEAAEFVWHRLPGRKVQGEVQRQGGDLGAGRGGDLGMVQAEWGEADGGLAYLYVRGGDRSKVLLVGGRETGTVSQAVQVATGDDEALVALVQGLAEAGAGAATPPDQVPLYENHRAAAQAVRTALSGTRIIHETTVRTPAGAHLHAEFGEVGGLVLVYVATTADERQLILVERERGGLLEAYCRELVAGAGGEAKAGGSRT